MLVCTLPSPACMCSATNTRPLSISLWIAVQRSSTGLNARPAKISSSGAFSSVFHDTTSEWSCSAGNVSSMRSARSCQRARVAWTSARASSTLASIRSCAGRASSLTPHTCASGARREECVERGAERQLVGDRQLDVDALDAVGVVAEAVERNDHVLVHLERVGVLGDRRGARAVEPRTFSALRPTPRRSPRRRARSRCGSLPRPPSRRRRRCRRRCRRSGPSSAARGASPWSRSRPPSRSARPGARARPAARAPTPRRRRGRRRSA